MENQTSINYDQPRFISHRFFTPVFFSSDIKFLKENNLIWFSKYEPLSVEFKVRAGASKIKWYHNSPIAL